MAAESTLAPPASPGQSQINIVESGPPKPPPKPTSTIRVSQMPTTVTPTEPKKGSAMDQMRADLEKKYSGRQADTTAPKTETKAKQVPTVPKTETPAETQAPETETEAVAPETQTPETETPSTDKPTVPKSEKTAAEPAKDKKTNPWKLADEWKARATKAEAEALEVRKQLVPETERKAIEERIQKAETRAKELEDEIRYVNYQKSEEFLQNYQKPYEDAFTRAMGDLKEVLLKDPNTGQDRPMSGDDLAHFAFMSLVQAKQAAMQVAPDFADDIMAARKEVRTLWDKRQQAIEDAKKNGSTREQQRAEQWKQQQSELSKTIRESWEKVTKAALDDPDNGVYFKPREGDTEWNQRLAKGYELVDRAYNENPTNPRITPEERASIIRRHAAVRHRAASWGAVKYENTKLKSEIAELKAELAKYSDVEPTTGGSETTSETSGPMSAMEEAKAKLRKLAHL